MNGIVFGEGLRSGVVLAGCVVVLAVLGLTPSLSWIPEVPLLGVAILIPVAVLGITGYRASFRSRRVVAGALAGAIAGSLGGTVGGICYVLFGKSAINVLAGLPLGILGGAAFGAAGSVLSQYRRGPTLEHQPRERLDRDY